MKFIERFLMWLGSTSFHDIESFRRARQDMIRLRRKLKWETGPMRWVRQ